MDSFHSCPHFQSLDESPKLINPGSLAQEGFENVLVLAKKTKLTTAQLTLLNRGLNFIPTKGINKNIIPQSKFDLQNYHRRLKLWAHFDGGDTGPKKPFTPKSTWTPPDLSMPDYVRQLIGTDLDYFNNSFKILRTKPNLTPEENVALRELAQNREIVIKPADKGSMVVVMDRDQYLWEGNKQLEDATYYSKLSKPIYLNTRNQIINIFQKIRDKKLIDAKQYKYLIGEDEPRPRRFYLLPKIHKDPRTWSRPYEIPPGRPIVSDCDSESYRSAEFIDFYLNPLAKLHQSYIKDTYDFINKIKNLNIPTHAFLFTMDVESLYTNIVTAEGIKAVRDVFQKHYDKTRPDKEILQLLEINLTKNDFEFDNKFYLQIKGTAMGKRFAPAYADIFMASWEEAALSRCTLKPLHYFRYLDDIWGIWNHSATEFDKFLENLNNWNSSIRLKATFDKNAVNFLDTTTFKGPKFAKENKLDIKIYFKDTDTHALLHRSSFHPRHTFAGIVKSQLLRFNRICTQPEDFRKASKVLFRALASRGYTRSFLRHCFKTFQDRKPLKLSTPLPLVTTYSLSTIQLTRQIKKNLEKMINLNKPNSDLSIIAAFRKNKNLRDHLVRAKLTKSNKEHRIISQGYFKQIKWVFDVSQQRVYKTATHGSVNTSNCVYLITCEKCQKKYVGETGLTIRGRFVVHKHNIIRKKNTERHVVQHFVLHGWEAVRVCILECGPDWTTAQRRRTERNWIKRLGTTYPNGLNERLYFRA